MVIFNNMAAMSALNETNRNTGKLGKVLKQAVSGMRINSAGDDASGYSISERMRVKIRALGQCKENSAKGQDLIDTALAAVDQQVNIMKQVKTIALRATDGTYTDKDRNNLQKELSQLLDQSEEISHTQFNGIHLLDQKTISHVTKWFDSDVPYRPNLNNTPVIADAATGDYDVPIGSYVDISLPVYDPNTPVQGSSLTSLPSVGSWVWDDAHNCHAQVFQDTTDNSLHLGSVSGDLIEVAGFQNPPGAANATSTNVSAVSLQQITNSPADGTSIALSGQYPPLPTGIFSFATNPYTNNPAYKLNGSNGTYNYIAEVDLSALSSSVADIPKGLDGLGFSLKCKGTPCDQFVTVMFDATVSDTKFYEGSTGNPKPMCYVIGVSNVSNVPSLEESLGAAIFNGINAVTPAGGTGAVIPSGSDASTTIASKHNIKLNYYSATGKLAITKDGPGMVLMNGIMGEIKYDIGFKPEQKMYLQTEDKGSQNTKIYLQNTTNAMLFPKTSDSWDIDPQNEDYPDEWPKGYENLSDAQKRVKWKNEVWRYPDKLVTSDFDNCVSSYENANKFLDNVDQAIKYLLDVSTTLGAQSSRLDYTKDNIVVMQENTTAAESVQRDADMAKVAMEQAKYNLLQQASQSMLAQANQTPNGVLSLLR